ncbi:hypothetical protein [Chryseobacterium sp.]|uniref:hypothetical protein n=1 Tax=Chryseobacterium sp. TaxID=1871047 RepID=UPI0028A145D9|nr:hypothetical protein [Chryseobacterium sp.]
MRTFIAKNMKNGLKIIFKFNLKGVLEIIEYQGDWTVVMVEKWKPHVPASTDNMLAEIQNQKPDKPWIFAEVTDVSFDSFYKKYPKKVGRREVTEKGWKKLSEVDQLEAILYIPELIKLKSDGTAFPYPATYLNQKLWK